MCREKRKMRMEKGESRFERRRKLDKRKKNELCRGQDNCMDREEGIGYKEEESGTVKKISKI